MIICLMSDVVGLIGCDIGYSRSKGIERSSEVEIAQQDVAEGLRAAPEVFKHTDAPTDK